MLNTRTGMDKPGDLGQQFRLLLVHVRTRVIQKQLVIPVHGERALVDQEDDQTNCENSEDHRHDSSHKPPRPDSNQVRRLSRPNRYNFDPYSVPLLRIDYWSVLTKVGLHAFHQCPERVGRRPVRDAYFVKVVASDHTRIRIPRNVRCTQPSGRIFDTNYRKLEEVGKWLLNYARNANKPIPVASAITTKKVNTPRRLPPMRSLNPVTSHQKKRKTEVRYDV